MRMIGVDVGGTFTDAVLHDDDSGELRWAKVASTPQSPAQGVLAAIEQNDVALAQVDRFVHGLTTGTNAILERTGAAVWMLTTRGFRDTLEIARTNRTTLYDIKTLKPPPLVPRRRVIEIDERLGADGAALIELDLAQIDAAAEALKGEGPAALAVCFLHSYANPAHEQAATKRLRELLPDWFVCSSTEVLPEMREYERFNTTALNCYIGPLTARYLATLTDLLRERGYARAVYLMISSGGIVTAERAARLPVQTVLSGPAGGVAAARHFGELLGLKNLITYDMGGTSTDVCLIEDLEVPVTTDQYIEGYPIRAPQIEILTVGAGGGSIAWVESGDILKVGPRSAGAAPGPACYGAGGTEPTVTDANLLLGRLSAKLKLAGSLALREDLAARAVARISGRIAGLDARGAADGIIRIAVARMVSAIKEISITRGYDPRDFTLVAYGGAGPMHAAFIAEELEIEHILVPPSPGNFSAFGALISDIRHDHIRSYPLALEGAGLDTIEHVFGEIEGGAREALVAEGMPGELVTTTRACGMRYVGQSWDLIVPINQRLESAEQLERSFHQAHERRFGYRMDAAVEVVSFRVSAIGRVEKPKLFDWPAAGSLEAAQTEQRPVHFTAGAGPAPVYRRERLPRGARFAGPAIVEEMGAVTVVPPGWSAEVGRYGEITLGSTGR